MYDFNIFKSIFPSFIYLIHIYVYIYKHEFILEFVEYIYTKKFIIYVVKDHFNNLLSIINIFLIYFNSINYCWKTVSKNLIFPKNTLSILCVSLERNFLS